MEQREEEEEVEEAIPSPSGRSREDKPEEEEEEESEEGGTWDPRKQAQIVEVSGRLIKGELKAQVEAAWDIRNIVRRSSSSNYSSTKTRSRFAAAGVIKPLVLMLNSSNLDALQASLLALLNLAARNDRNKVKIVTAGAVPPLVELLKFQSGTVRELATAAILTLSAAEPNKPTIVASGVTPYLVQILSSGSVQGRVDAVTALYYLSNPSGGSHPTIDANAVSPLINLLKECKKYSKFAEKTTALLEILCKTEEGRIALTNSDDGILTLVETVEDGSHLSANHAVGALLCLCQSYRDKYRILILREGAIPGLLWLTVEGSSEAQERARALLDLLRDTPQEKRLASAELDRIAYDIAARVDGSDKAAETAKRLLQDRLKEACR